MTKKKISNTNEAPPLPVSRPMAPIKADTGWGRTLTKKELMALIDRIYAKKEEEKMSKLTDTLKRALEKKKGITHPENDETPAVDAKKKVKTAPPTGKKPPTRSAGRGR